MTPKVNDASLNTRLTPELLERIRAYTDPEHDESPLKMELCGYAAGEAIKYMLQNWSDAMASGPFTGKDMTGDVMEAIEQLALFGKWLATGAPQREPD